MNDMIAFVAITYITYIFELLTGSIHQLLTTIRI